MRMLKIEDSSNVAAVGYDGLGVLRVRFKNGGLYEYQNVPPHKFAALIAADSVGRYIHSDIRSQVERHYSRRIEPEQYEIGQRLMINLRLVKATVMGVSHGHGLCYELMLDKQDFKAEERMVWLNADELRDVEELDEGVPPVVPVGLDLHHSQGIDVATVLSGTPLGVSCPTCHAAAGTPCVGPPRFPKTTAGDYGSDFHEERCEPPACGMTFMEGGVEKPCQLPAGHETSRHGLGKK